MASTPRNTWSDTAHRSQTKRSAGRFVLSYTTLAEYVPNAAHSIAGRGPQLTWLCGLPEAIFIGMGRHGRLLVQILGGRADTNVGFEALCALLRRLGFTERTRGSHHVFQRAGVEELTNLQRDGEKAKVYQVRQVRTVLLRYGLTTLEGDDT